jgi:16S rRNA processing protein RimM
VTNNATDFIAIGRIVAPHGVRGELRVAVLTEFPERFLDMKRVLVEGKGEMTVTGVRTHQDIILMTLAEVKDRDAASALRGRLLQVTRAELMPLPEGQFYVFDLVGVKVFDEAGQELGVLEEVLQPGANDVYLIRRTDGSELLLPALRSVVLTVDMLGRRMVVKPPVWDDEA